MAAVAEPLTMGEAELEQVAGHLAAAKSDRAALDADAAEKRASVERELEQLAVDLAIGEADRGRVERRRAELNADLDQIEARRADAARAEEGLGRRCDELAAAIQRAYDARDEAEAAAEREAVREARQVLAAAEHNHQEGELRRAAAREVRGDLREPYNPDVRAAAAAGRRQRSERVRSLARHPRWRWEREVTSAAERRAVEEEVARLDAEERERLTRFADAHREAIAS